MSGVSNAEQVCLSENIDPDGLMLLVETPELATGEEAATMIGCLEHETLLRLFLTAVLEQTGPLSAESSVCIRDGFADIDLAAVMMVTGTESGEDPEAEAGMMAGFFSALSCLNEEEFQAASPALGMNPGDLEGLQCLMEELGGAEGLAALMQPDAGPPIALFSAAMSCNLELSGEPAP